MVSLVDIGDLKDTVQLRGKDVELGGVTAVHIVGIFFKFPEVRVILTQNSPDTEIVMTLVARAPEAVAILIAHAACDASPDSAEFTAAVEAAKKLTVGEQYLVLQKVATITFPQGMQNFLDGVQGLLAQANGGLGWAPATTLPAQSSDASQQAETSETAGTAPQDSSAHGSS